MQRIEMNGGRDYLDWRQGSGNTVEIYDILVSSERRKGIGRTLVYELMDHRMPRHTRLVWAIMRSTNGIAKQFYEALKFRPVGVLWGFYRDGAEGVDAIMYGRDIG